ncbi:hypothetical protein L1987_02188 [Smallanthus sonchifolius]|uniref:Uncharacterized protein n=1 Tax=Smallanthus sonchifolius TaxID=185202 RepID=A0ACB9K702_9ASTR|nr:hypothetical protein L1987_02188 [Smallanthus sonchifolius]
MAHVLRKLEMALQFQVGHALDLEKDYLDVLRAEIPPLAYKSVEEVKVLLSKGILLNEGKRWLSLSESGELCEMVCAADCVITDRSDHNRLPLFFEYNSPLYKSRFAEPNFYKSHTGIFRTHVGAQFKREAFNPTKKCFRIECKIKTRILSPQETYACYLVYKLPEDHSEFEAPLKVRDKDFYKEDWEDTNYNNEHWEKTDYRFVFLVSPPQTPVIGQKIDRNAHNHMSNRHKLKGHPLLRNDGWMEVQVWEFQTGTSREQIVMRVDLVSSINVYLKGLIVQGVEFKPISS